MHLRSLAAALVVVCLAAGCGDRGETGTARPATTTSAPGSPAPSTTTSPAAPPAATASASEASTPIRGIDASHHQGPIDWAQVADHGIAFAYLKASEGTGFVDPRFADNRAAAERHGIAVSGYHYFQLCSDGAAQAAHFVDVLGDGGAETLAPALDLELAGSCTTPPARDVLLAEVREFLALVDEHYATSTVVYLYPDFEERFGFASELADHPQWVRRLGDRAPRRPWQVWQYDDRGSVPGITGGVDLNLMQPPS